MEEKLKKFIEQNKLEEVDCDAITRFLHHQVMELARDCLQKSQDKQITGSYFFELSEKLEKLLIDVSDEFYSLSAVCWLSGKCDEFYSLYI